MVEFVMIFALGALAAMLLALSALPALDRRAQRLARRRLEALFPMSIAEIAAERDHVRAAMAVEARRVEERADAASRDRAAALAEIGRRDIALRALNDTAAARDASIAGLEQSFSDAKQRLAQAEARLAEADSARAESGHVLESLRAAQQELGVKLDASLRLLAEREQALRVSQERLAAAQTKLTESAETEAALQAELRRAIDTASERQLTIAALDAQLESALGETRELTRQLAQARDALAQRAGVGASESAGLVANSNDAPGVEQAGASGLSGPRARPLPEAAE